MVLVGLLRFLNYLLHQASPTKQKVHRFPLVSLYKNHILEAPLHGLRRATAHEWFHGSLIVRVPGRIHTLAILALLVTNLVCCFAFYHPIPEDIKDIASEQLGGKWMHIYRSFADRTALLALAQLPLVFLFSGRNSPVVLLTECNFNTLMLYHRWIARIVTVLTLGHAVGYTIVYAKYDYYFQSFHENWWNWGIAALAMWFAACFFSYTIFRRWSYELFLLLHIVFVAWSFAALWKHISIIEGQVQSPFMVFLFVALGLWVFDRLVRFLRMVGISIHIPALLRGQKGGLTTATVRELPDGVLVVRFRPAGSCSGLLTMHPGQHLYINIPRIQSLSLHPFTILTTGTDAEGQQGQDQNNKWIDVGIRPVHGFSHLLAQYHAKNGSQQTELTAFLEGPYGHCVDTRGYTSCILLAAGIGVTHTLCVLLEACKAACAKADSGSSSSSSTHASPSVASKGQPQRFQFIWVIRSPTSLPLVLPYLVQAMQQMKKADALGALNIEAQIFISSEAFFGTLSTNSANENLGQLPQLSRVPLKSTPTSHFPVVTEEERDAKTAAWTDSNDAPSPYPCSPAVENDIKSSPGVGGGNASPATNGNGVSSSVPSDRKTWTTDEEEVIEADIAGNKGTEEEVFFFPHELEGRLERFLQQQMVPDCHLREEVHVLRQNGMGVRFQLGRPRVRDVLQETVTSSPECQTYRGRQRVLVTSCGPASFSDEVRHVIRQSRTTRLGIDYDEEVFAW